MLCCKCHKNERQESYGWFGIPYSYFCEDCTEGLDIKDVVEMAKKLKIKLI